MEDYKFTDEVKLKFLQLLENGNSRRAALEECGITRYTLYRHFAKYPAFKQMVEEAEACAIDTVEDALYEKALKGNTTAQIFFLKCRRGDKWNDKPAHEAGFSREELEQKVEQLIEIAVRRIPEEDRAGFINDLRALAGVAEGGRQSIEAPAPEPD